MKNGCGSTDAGGFLWLKRGGGGRDLGIGKWVLGF